MSEISLNLLTFLGSLFTIWAGSGLIVSSIAKLSQKLHLPAFIISFVVLGILTSTPEIAVGLSAISSGTPSIFVGNLLGGIPVIFLFIIPLLAILGKGINLSHKLSQGSILLTLVACITPFLIVIDSKVTNNEGIFSILIYLVVVFLLYKNNTVNKEDLNLFRIKSYSFIDILKVFGGTAIVLFSSNIIVSRTLYFSQIYNIAPFYISLIVLSIGTNLPELTIAIRSIISGRKDIAFGDYLGSSSANAFLFGVFTLMTSDSVLKVDNFLVMFIIVAFGLLLFFHFSRTKRSISPKEGFILLSIYLLFVIVELAPRFINNN